METEKKIVGKEITRIEFNLEELEDWRDEEGFPVYGILKFYEAIGLLPFVKEYSETHEECKFTGADNLTCNFYTLKRIKNFITKQWQQFPINLTGNEKIVWDRRRGEPNKKTCKKSSSLSKKLQASLSQNFVNFCPSLDDELVDNTIVFTVFEESEIVIDENTGEEFEVIEAEE